MDWFNTNSGVALNFSWVQSFLERPSLRAGASGSPRGIFGRSVREHGPQISGRPYPVETGSGSLCFSRTVGYFSIRLISPIAGTATLTEITSPENLYDTAPVDGDFALTELATANSRQIAQTSSQEHFSATCSQPSLHPVTVAEPATTQQSAHEEAADSKPAEFFSSCESPPNEANYRARPETCDQAHLTEIALFAEAVTAQLSLTNPEKTPTQSTNHPTKKTKNKDFPVKKQKKPKKNKITQDEREPVKNFPAPEKSLATIRNEAYYKAYQRAYQSGRRAELTLSGDKDKAKRAGQAAGRAAGKAAKERIAEATTASPDNSLPLLSHLEIPESGSYFKAYRRAYIRAQRKAYKQAYSSEIALSGNKDRAKRAGKAAGQAAGRTAGQAAMEAAKVARSAL